MLRPAATRGAEVVGGDADGGDRDVVERAGGGAEVGQRRGGDPGAVDHDQRGQGGDPVGLAPKGEIDEAVGADQEEEVVAGTLGGDGREGLGAVVGAGAAGLDLGDLEGGVAGRGDPRHLQAVGHRRPAGRLVRRRPRHHEPDPVQRAGLAAGLGQEQVPQVDRVERAAEDAQPHRVDPRGRFRR